VKSWLGRLWPGAAQDNSFSATWDDESGTPRHTTDLGRWSNEIERCDVLDAYYRNESLYRNLSAELADRRYKGYSGFRNPASRLIELYVAKLTDRLFESLDTGGNDELAEQINLLYEWSNWKDRIEEAARDLTIYGIEWVKVEQNDQGTRIQRNLLDPRVVTYFEMDARDILTYLRLDTAFQIELGSGEEKDMWRTEIWDKGAELYEAWEHDLGPQADEDDIRDTSQGKSKRIERAFLATELPDGRSTGTVTGYDFIPVVCRRIRVRREDPRGRGVFQHILDPIDELARQAQKLSQMMFPEIYCVITREKGARGGDLQDIHLQGEDAARALARAQQEGYRVIDVEGVKTIRLAEGQDMKWSIPPIDFSGHVSAMDNFVRESIEKDAPELTYYRLREFGQPPSGVAADTMMADLRDRILNVRAKFEDAEVRINKMALTLAKLLQLEDFQSVGEYESGDLDHKFKPYILFPKTPLEQAQEAQTDASAITAYLALPEPILKRYLEERGYTREQVEAILKVVAESKEKAQAGTNAAEAPAAASILDTVRAVRGEDAVPIAPADTTPAVSPFVGQTGDLRIVRPRSGAA